MSSPPVDPRFPGRLKQLRTHRGMPLRELARRTNFGKSYLHQFETGARTPSREHVTRLDEALGAGGELVALVADPGPVGYAITHPGSADVGAADQLADALVDARRTEDEVGAAPMLTVASTRLATVESVARQARAPVRPKLIRVAAQWAQWGGWLHLAVARHRRAGAWLDRALEWAIEADDRELVATVLSFKAYGAGLVNEPGAMVALTEAGYVIRVCTWGSARMTGFSLLAGTHCLENGVQPWRSWPLLPISLLRLRSSQVIDRHGTTTGRLHTSG